MDKRTVHFGAKDNVLVLYSFSWTKRLMCFWYGVLLVTLMIPRRIWFWKLTVRWATGWSLVKGHCQGGLCPGSLLLGLLTEGS